MMEGDEIVSLETSGLSAMRIADKWVVGRRCEAEITMFPTGEPDTSDFGFNPDWPIPGIVQRPAAYISMEVLAIAPTLSEALAEALRVVRAEKSGPVYSPGNSG